MYNRTTSFTALGPAMPIEKTIQFDCQPAQLWEIVGTPDRVDWVPGVTNCEFDGEVRSLSLPGAGAIKEKILSRDADAMHMQYSCIESPFHCNPIWRRFRFRPKMEEHRWCGEPRWSLKNLKSSSKTA